MYKIENGEIYYVSSDEIIDRELEIPEEIGGEIVTSIRDGTFEGRDDIDLVACPKTLKRIGYRAFYNSSLKEVFLPPDLLEIGASAFERSLIESINLYGKRFGCHTFAHCPNLTEVIFNNQSETAVGMFLETPVKSVIGWESLRKISVDTFKGCKMSHIAFRTNSRLLEIGNGAFMGCSVKSVHLPTTLKSIGSAAFRDCHLLNSINIPASIVEIGDTAFMGCKSLTNISWPLPSISEGTFSDCKKLSKISFKNKVSYIGRFAFYGTGFSEFDWPEGVSLLKGVFANCSKLTKFYTEDSKVLLMKNPKSSEYFYDSKHITVLSRYMNEPVKTTA